MTDSIQMTRLQPMTEADFLSYKEYALADYSNGSKIGSWKTAAEALSRFGSAFPDGLATSGVRLFAIVDDVTIGYLVAREIDRDGVRECFIFDIAIRPSSRRAGHARNALDQLRTLASGEGFDRIGLSVLPENEAAISLYESAGYTTGFIRYQLLLKS